jgi:hypothetical protein
MAPGSVRARSTWTSQLSRPLPDAGRSTAIAPDVGPARLRLSLTRPELFRVQLRARCSAPRIAAYSVSVRIRRRTAARARRLIEETPPISRCAEAGARVPVASRSRFPAAYTADLIAREVTSLLLAQTT